MQVIKLGGSIITNKSKYRSFRKAIVARLVHEIAKAKTPTVIIHGAGSFGHILAKKHELGSGFRDLSQLKGFAEVHRDVRELNMLIIKELFKVGINAVSLPPGSFVKANGGEINSIETHKFEEYLALGLSPVTFGDVILDSKIGFFICSGDALVLHITKNLDARRAIFVTDVDGVYGRKRGREHLLTELKTIEQIGKPKKSYEHNIDVTGGIKNKARVMLQLKEYGIESILINGNKKGRLLAALTGKPVLGTSIHAQK
jgi:isopentenyl phosphate kinase